jgi:hypothetical protein
MAIMSDIDDGRHYEAIWLQPWCDGCEMHCCEGRQWCQDDIWGKCDECENKSVRYVIAKKAKKNLDAAMRDHEARIAKAQSHS